MSDTSSTMSSSWSNFFLDEGTSRNDRRDWHLYRVVVSNGQYTDTYDRKRYSKRDYPE
jgi:hypothetical protein